MIKKIEPNSNNQNTQTTPIHQNIDIPPHFSGKEAIEHVAEKQAHGILSSGEIHGTEIPGHLYAATDSARDMAIILLMVWIILHQTNLSELAIIQTLGVFAIGWAFWKAGRSAWMAWFRLERMHRIVQQERWEIQHHRPQEREELYELYRAKGFNGKLLDDVVNVLMADEDRLLRVMVEEELRLTIGTQDHPLKQAAGSMIGSLVSAFICLMSLIILSKYGMPHAGLWCGSLLIISMATGFAAYREGNRLIPSLVWILGIASLAIGAIYFLFEYV